MAGRPAAIRPKTLIVRIVEAIGEIGRDFTAGEVADLIPDAKRDTVLSIVGIAAKRGHCHAIGFETNSTGGYRTIYRVGAAPRDFVPPIHPSNHRNGTQSEVPKAAAFEHADKRWRERARGASRFDAALTANEAAQLRRIKQAWLAS